MQIQIMQKAGIAIVVLRGLRLGKKKGAESHFLPPNGKSIQEE